MANMIKSILGLFMLCSALMGYRFAPNMMYELTFLSNFSCGALLLADGVLGLWKKKSLPFLLYQLLLPCIFAVFFTVIFRLFGWYGFNFYGWFLFLHGINPVVFMIMYLFFAKSERKDTQAIGIFLAPALVLAYAAFDWIRFLRTGKLIYGLISPNNLNFITAPLIGIGLYLFAAFISFLFLALKWCLQKPVQPGT